MPMVSTNFGKLLAPGLRKIYGDAYAQYPEEYSKVFEIDTTDRAWEEDQSLTGFGLVPEKPQGESIVYTRAYQGYTKRYTVVTYGLGFMVARELLDDGLYRNIKSMPRALARSVSQTVEILAANVLNNAFSSSYPGADGVSLVNSAHPLVAGGSFSNALSTPADLDITSLEQAVIELQDMVDDRGLKVAASPITLVVPPQLDWKARVILRSEQKPGTNYNDTNPALGVIRGGHVVMHWLTDPDAWFIKTDVPNGLTWLWRRKPDFADDKSFDNETAKFKVTFRCVCGFTDPRCIFGSPGA